MTAYRYFQKYRKQLFMPTEQTPDVVEAIKAIFGDFIDEAIAIGTERGIILWSQLYTILSDQNTKWNRVIKYATDKYGFSPLQWNCILNFSKDHCAQLLMSSKGVFK